MFTRGLVFALALSTFLFTARVAQAFTFTVMAYNLENFFDAEHDEGKEDFQYLPLELKKRDPAVQEYCATQTGFYRERCFNMNYSEEIFYKKSSNLAHVIMSANKSGVTPDILIFEEIENIQALKRLIDVDLQGQGYVETLLVEGPDKRGIDVAIVSKFKLSSEIKYHQIDLSPVYTDQSKVKLTRGILEATFEINGRLVTVLANHWPSQNNPDAARVIAAQTLIKATANAPGYVIAAGDFNVVVGDSPNAINDYLLNPNGDMYFYDAEKKYYGEQTEQNKGNLVPERGTYFYKNHWDSLDHFFTPRNHVSDTCDSKGKVACFHPNYDSFVALRLPFATQDVSGKDPHTGRRTTFHGVPKRFDDKTGEGYSDHLPIMMSFDIF